MAILMPFAQEPTSFTPVGNGADSPDRNHLKEYQLLHRGSPGYPTPGSPSLVNHYGVLGRQWDERRLGRRKACRVKHALAHIFYFPVSAIR